MPNHVMNRLVADTKTIESLLSVENGKKVVDFENLIPRPEDIVSLNIPSHVEMAAEIALGLIDFSRQPNEVDDIIDRLELSNAARQLKNGPNPKDFSDADFDLWLTYLKAWRNHGCMHWLDWSIKHWGTKWNAYETKRIDEATIQFETAWSPPHQVIQKLAEISNTSISHEWADEDTGSNVGFRIYENGQIAKEVLLDGSKEGYELCFKLKPSTQQYYKFVDGKYEYVDD